MDFSHTAKVIEAKEQLEAFMDEHVYPREREHHDFVMDGDNLWKQPAVVEELKVKAQEAPISGSCGSAHSVRAILTRPAMGAGRPFSLQRPRRRRVRA